MIKKISGRHAVSGLVGISACLLSGHSAFAWQQEYIVSDPQSNTAERYTWDADHQPRYDDILAERIQSSQNAPGLALNLPSGSTSAGAMSVGWNFPLAGHVTTGPVVAWRYDGTTPMMINEFGDSVTTQALTDPLWHASVSTLAGAWIRNMANFVPGRRLAITSSMVKISEIPVRDAANACPGSKWQLDGCHRRHRYSFHLAHGGVCFLSAGGGQHDGRAVFVHPGRKCKFLTLLLF
ncbi:putative lipase [Enterobacter cloacae]|uniref:Putative lipase n=1 Tax=Enterobacter cloacae TaxID=550 RepID=A0A377LPL1_ENTCL|nr:putative lipase [Enterobacter cloacae]